MAVELNKTLIRIYVNLVKNNRRTLDEVLEDYREAVKAELEK